MSTSIHGWPVITKSNDSRLRLFPIPGVANRSLRLREDVGPYLVAFASEYHKLISPLNKGTFDDWSWSPPRDGRASSKPSDHCAGVAIDLNATKEGAQNRANWTSFWKKPLVWVRVVKLKRKYKLLEWGGEYKRFYDPMHWTFKYGVGASKVKAEMKRLGIDSKGRLTK